jgi:hypothetical protein
MRIFKVRSGFGGWLSIKAECIGNAIIEFIQKYSFLIKESITAKSSATGKLEFLKVPV